MGSYGLHIIIMLQLVTSYEINMVISFIHFSYTWFIFSNVLVYLKCEWKMSKGNKVL